MNDLLFYDKALDFFLNEPEFVSSGTHKNIISTIIETLLAQIEVRTDNCL